MNLYQYFQPHQNYFWQWEDQAEVIAINNGNTIVYKDLMFKMLKSIHPQGIPPFGAFLLALVATNPNAQQDKKEAYEILQTIFTVPNNLENLKLTFAFLEVLTALPEEYKTGKKRIQVFQTIFEDSHNLIGTKWAKRLVKKMGKGEYDAEQLMKKKPFSINTFNNDLKCLRLLLRRFPSPQSILDGIANLPEPIEEIPLDSTQENTSINEPKDFVEELISHYKTFYVGTLIKRIWSGMNIPMQSILPNEQRLGGVADLTNKGTFDKLLISEFAYDDLTFLSRLANQEALYLNRERPPNNDALERFILVDASLKTWGKSKNIAYAVMLAIAKHPKSKIASKAFSLGNDYREIQYEDINQLIDSFQHLTVNLYPTNALEAFLKDHKKSAEIVLITASNALKDLPMQQLIAQYQNRIRYVIATEEEGKIDIYRNQNHSRKHLQSIQLPLEQLWSNKNKRVQNRQDSPKNYLDIKGTKYPLLFPPQRTRQVLIDNDNNMFAISNDKKLFRLPDSSSNVSVQNGWHLLLDQLPSGSTHFVMGQIENGPHILFCYIAKDKKVILLNLSNGEQKHIHFSEHPELNFYSVIVFKDNKFTYQFSGKQWAFSYQQAGVVKEEIYEKQLYHHYAARNVAANRAKNKINAHNFLKNVKSVYIDRQFNLFVNSHKLNINQQNQIKLIQLRSVGNANVFIKATRSDEYKNIFEFPDGSSVGIHQSGLLILKSSDKNLSPIYIPTVLDAPLGITTSKEFTGNSFYWNKFYMEEALHIISPQTFYSRYIKAFTQNIFNRIR